MSSIYPNIFYPDHNELFNNYYDLAELLYYQNTSPSLPPADPSTWPEDCRFEADSSYSLLELNYCPPQLVDDAKPDENERGDFDLFLSFQSVTTQPSSIPNFETAIPTDDHVSPYNTNSVGEVFSRTLLCDDDSGCTSSSSSQTPLRPNSVTKESSHVPISTHRVTEPPKSRKPKKITHIRSSPVKWFTRFYSLYKTINHLRRNITKFESILGSKLITNEHQKISFPVERKFDFDLIDNLKQKSRSSKSTNTETLFHWYRDVKGFFVNSMIKTVDPENIFHIRTIRLPQAIRDHEYLEQCFNNNNMFLISSVLEFYFLTSIKCLFNKHYLNEQNLSDIKDLNYKQFRFNKRITSTNNKTILKQTHEYVARVMIEKFDYHKKNPEAPFL